jgi:radical SAM superfamily enzyme YgiQ (UPF0313 family)
MKHRPLHGARIALVQPCAEMVFAQARNRVTELPSLGFARLGTELRRAGFTITGIIPGDHATRAAAAVGDVDVVIIGDLRPYAYFCNPVPLLQHLVATLAEAGFVGHILVTGRCIPQLKPAALGTHESIRLELCPDMPALARALALPGEIGDALGSGPLPAPGLADPDLLVSSEQRLTSRPVASLAGQVMTTEGCRFRCAFCEKAGTPVRALTPSVLREHLAGLVAHGVGYVIVWDEVFGQTGERVNLAREFAEAGLAYGCNTRADLIDDGFATLLAETGCRSVLMGLEVADDESVARRRVRVDRSKSPPFDRIRKVIDRLNDRGVKAVGSAIVGVPGDTLDIVSARLTSFRRLELAHLYVRPLVPFPGTQLFRETVSAGLLPELSEWTASNFPTYPWGYPLLPGSPDRSRLAALAGWAS